MSRTAVKKANGMTYFFKRATFEFSSLTYTNKTIVDIIKLRFQMKRCRYINGITYCISVVEHPVSVGIISKNKES